MKPNKKMYSHRKIVDEILPRFAERLQREGLISTHNRKPFRINLEPLRFPIEIRPDRLLCLSNGSSILVEVVNPKDSKRVMGEVFAAQLLGSYKLISAVVFFILPNKNKYEGIHEKRLENVLAESFLMDKIPQAAVSWIGEESGDYFNLRSFLIEYLRSKQVRTD